MSKQIIDNQNILVLNEMSWDSEFFDCSAYSLDTALTKLENPIQDSNILSKELKRSFITVKLPTNVSSLYLANLFVYGFNYIDTEVILRFDNRKVMLETTPFEIKELIVNKDIPYHELGSMFTSSRFHNDVNISSIKANILWIEYLKNFKPSKERKMFVAYDNASIIGVILVNITDQRCATLFYVSILKEYQGQGAGKLLINHVLAYLTDNKITEIRTETQIKNINALNFYIKNGFTTIEKTLTVLHRWE